MNSGGDNNLFTAKCVIVGDGAVGKVNTIESSKYECYICKCYVDLFIVLLR